MKLADRKTYPDICSASSLFKGILLDASGVFWMGSKLGMMEGAQESFEKLRAQGKIIGIVTNSSQLFSKQMDTFQKHGLIHEKHFHFLLTSGDVTRSFFLKRKLPFAALSKTFFLFGEPHPNFASHEAIFQETPWKQVREIETANCIYLSIPHVNGEDQTNPEVFRNEIEKIRPYNLPMICSNPDLFALEGNPPRPVVRQGSIAKMYEEMGGKVYYQGKPDRSLFKEALRFFRQYGIFHSSDILMVGDTPETDIRGANRVKIPSALILKTGIMAERIAPLGLKRALEALLPQDLPNFFIESFPHAF
jgi:HAD superfamily hydrolase (TIGR01459 family)